MNEIVEKIKEVKEKSKPRRFIQTWDLSINIKGLNLKKPENRFNFEFSLPEGRGKEIKVAVIADSLVAEAKSCADMVIKKSELDSFIKNKKELRKLVNKYDWFLGEASLMPLIGKSLGSILGPRGKMPKPIPPNANLKALVQQMKRTIRIGIKDNPVIHVPVGNEKMHEESITKNIEAVLNIVKEKLPKGRGNIKSVFIKLTMSKPVKLKV